MPISRCSRPPPRTCWQSRRSDEIKTKLEETVKLLRLCRSLPLRLLTGRLLPCILFIYLFPICTNWKQRTAKGGGRYPESIPPETAGKTIGSAAGSAAHCSHRAGALLYHCTGVTQHPAVLSAYFDKLLVGIVLGVGPYRLILSGVFQRCFWAKNLVEQDIPDTSFGILR